MFWTAPSRVPAVLLALAFALGGWTAPVAAQDTDNVYTSRLDVRGGRRLFRAQCSTCHGLNGTGGEEGAGPDLTTGRFRHASTDAGLYRVIRDGVEGTAMIGVGADATDQSVWQLVTYLRTLGAVADVADLAGSPEAGVRLFAGKGDCARCHIVNGQGGRLGPDLSDVGRRRDPDELAADLRDPGAEVDPRWWTMRVTRRDGSVIEGLRMDEDTFSYRIMDAEENLRSFSKYGGASYERITTSTMPGYAQALTTSEVDDLVAYLFSLRTERP
jgi:putative heme-binding domain-containing protein